MQLNPLAWPQSQTKRQSNPARDTWVGRSCYRSTTSSTNGRCKSSIAHSPWSMDCLISTLEALSISVLKFINGTNTDFFLSIFLFSQFGNGVSPEAQAQQIQSTNFLIISKRPIQLIPGFPVDGFVQFNHMVFQGRGLINHSQAGNTKPVCRCIFGSANVCSYFSTLNDSLFLKW